METARGVRVLEALTEHWDRPFGWCPRESDSLGQWNVLPFGICRKPAVPTFSEEDKGKCTGQVKVTPASFPLPMWPPALVLYSLDWVNAKNDPADVRVSGDSSDNTKSSSDAQIKGEGWSAGPHSYLQPLFFLCNNSWWGKSGDQL